MSPDEWTAWDLTCQLSPRGRVRLADQLGPDGYLNDYTATIPLSADAPTTPWAMPLTDVHGYFHYIAFDLDAGHGNAIYDAAKLSHWLDELNIEHLVTRSGPTGGRHVWLSLHDGTDAAVVGTIGHLAAQLLPSLDITPLRNPATGSVRPPGAPHRQSGYSEPIGSVATLTAHSVTAEQLQSLHAFLIDTGATIKLAPVTPIHGVSVDEGGYPHLTGSKRPLTDRILNLLDAPPAYDTSHTQATVLAGCARARWRFADVLALLHVSPALEHSRTRRITPTQPRVPRSAAESRRALEHAWRRAVEFVAANPISGDGSNTEFNARAIAASEAIARVQTAADAMPGRWGLSGPGSAQKGVRGRFSHRAVLDALCLFIAQAASLTVEADQRRLSQVTGYSHEACRLALHALREPLTDDPESAWIVLVDAAEGAHGAKYRLSKKFSTAQTDQKLLQAVTHPSESPAADQRDWWINRLSSRLADLTHDVFSAPHSLGRKAGLTYSYLQEENTLTVESLTKATNLSASRIRKSLSRMHSAGLVDRHPDGWTRTAADTRDAAAAQLGVDGYLAARAARYDAERARWAWWRADLAWLSKRNKKRRGRRSATGVPLFAQNDRPDFPAYPRRNGRGHHGEAWDLILAGALSRPKTIEHQQVA
ncbi:hypothetical protein [Mycetocola zhujimingii]|uniref:hypothetical protein n=1 Tax=Mycetocola zhujimingii TaxID=2079792 RepID=UPI000D356C45|nr:hypothetical protein [Mycetocola zhujimingii]AWB88132.1 hypothetical protein C3E77_15255 [Mycetocola zhujimingii]